jgi:hypothetical protein
MRSGHQMTENFMKIVLDEKQKYSINEDNDRLPSENQIVVINAIETRRLHMIKRAKYMNKRQLALYFNDNQSNK